MGVLVKLKFRSFETLVMSFSRDEFAKVKKAMEKGGDKVEELKDQRNELLEANRRLVELVKKLEVALEEAEGGDVEFEGSEYSFSDGWSPTDIIHDEELDLGDDLDLDDIDSQVDQVIKTMRRVQNLNQQD